MKVWKLTVYGDEEGTYIRWCASKADAIDALRKARKVTPGLLGKYEEVPFPDTKVELLKWLNEYLPRDMRPA